MFNEIDITISQDLEKETKPNKMEQNSSELVWEFSIW